jgi:hypothetical protein
MELEASLLCSQEPVTDPDPEPNKTNPLPSTAFRFPFMLKNSGSLVRQQTIPTERPPLVGEFSANFSG